MKTIKLIFLSLSLVLFTLSSCTNEDAIVLPENQESASAKRAMSKLSEHYNNDGTLNAENNPTENIVFDYGFSFEFPITLKYNTYESITVDTHSKLVDLVVVMTENDYINNIDMPFSVTSYSMESNSMETISVTTESEFSSLVTIRLSSSDCVCTAEFIPVCVEIESPNGGSMQVNYPNACEAACDGFEVSDLVDCDDPCEGNYVLAPTADYEQTICLDDTPNPTVADLVVTNTDGYTDLYFYDVNGSIDTTTALTDGMLVKVSQDTGDCISYVEIEVLFDCDDTGSTCWSFVFPIEITNAGTTVNINDIDAFRDNYLPATSTLVYPFDVTINDETSTITTPNDFSEIGEMGNMCP